VKEVLKLVITFGKVIAKNSVTIFVGHSVYDKRVGHVVSSNCRLREDLGSVTRSVVFSSKQVVVNSPVDCLTHYSAVGLLIDQP